MTDSEEDFCTKMRKATREIHAISDALVNAKLAFGKNLFSRNYTAFETLQIK